MLQSVGSQRFRQDFATEQQQSQGAESFCLGKSSHWVKSSGNREDVVPGGGDGAGAGDKQAGVGSRHVITPSTADMTFLRLKTLGAISKAAECAVQ